MEKFEFNILDINQESVHIECTENGNILVSSKTLKIWDNELFKQLCLILLENNKENVVKQKHRFDELFDLANSPFFLFDTLLKASDSYSSAFSELVCKLSILDINVLDFTNCKELKEFASNSLICTELDEDCHFCFLKTRKIVFPPHLEKILDNTFENNLTPRAFKNQFDFTISFNTVFSESYFVLLTEEKEDEYCNFLTEWDFSNCVDIKTYNCKNFSFPKNFTKAKFSKNLESLEAGSFKNSEIVELDLLECDAIKEIPFEAFANSSIEKIYLPKTITRICKRAFYDSYLCEIDLSYCCDLRVIEEDAFWLSLLYAVKFPENLEIIGSYAFAGNYITSLDLSNIKLCSNLWIGIFAFKNNKITEIKFPQLKECNKNYVIIDAFAFNKCQLKEIEIPKNVFFTPTSFCQKTKILLSFSCKYYEKDKITGAIFVNLEKSAPADQDNLYHFLCNMYLNNEEPEEKYRILWEVPSDVKDFVIPSNVDTINSECFSNCFQLESVYVPSNSCKLPILCNICFRKKPYFGLMEFPLVSLASKIGDFTLLLDNVDNNYSISFVLGDKDNPRSSKFPISVAYDYFEAFEKDENLKFFDFLLTEV